MFWGESARFPAAHAMMRRLIGMLQGVSQTEEDHLGAALINLTSATIPSAATHDIFAPSVWTGDGLTNQSNSRRLQLTFTSRRDSSCSLSGLPGHLLIWIHTRFAC